MRRHTSILAGASALALSAAAIEFLPALPDAPQHRRGRHKPNARAQAKAHAARKARRRQHPRPGKRSRVVSSKLY